MKVRDPHSGILTDSRDLYVAEGSDGYYPVCGDDDWFVWYPATGATLKLSDAPADVRESLEQSVSHAGREIVDVLFQSSALADAVTLSHLDETIQPDGTTLKAIFMAGSGGSGKSAVAASMFAGTGMKYINMDRHFERMLKAAAVPMQRAGKAQDLFYRAKDLARMEMDHYVKARLGLVVDGTGWDYSRVAGPVKKLRELGYDVSMMFVSTSLKTALRRNIKRAEKGGRQVPNRFVYDAFKGANVNLPHYVRLFGRQNFFLIDNDRNLPPTEWQKEVGEKVHKIALRILSKPIKNPRGKAWLKRERGEAKRSKKVVGEAMQPTKAEIRAGLPDDFDTAGPVWTPIPRNPWVLRTASGVTLGVKRQGRRGVEPYRFRTSVEALKKLDKLRALVKK